MDGKIGSIGIIIITYFIIIHSPSLYRYHHIIISSSSISSHDPSRTHQGTVASQEEV